MTDAVFDTILMRACVERYQAGDAAAADQLFRTIGARMEFLTRRMLQSYPNVRAWTETADVMQNSSIRLLATLRKIQPTSTRHFFNLVTLHIRRELLDLARSFAGRREVLLDARGVADDSKENGLGQVRDSSSETAEVLELWCRFHEMVEKLPAEEAEVMSLVFYHGWTQVEIAELLQISERTVRTYWQSACMRLNRLMEGQLPNL